MRVSGDLDTLRGLAVFSGPSLMYVGPRLCFPGLPFSLVESRILVFWMLDPSRLFLEADFGFLFSDFF